MNEQSNAPDVTVLIAVYNGMPWLPQTIESVRRQTYQNWTLLLVNDGSTDGSADYLKSIEGPRIRVVHQANQGLGGALNTGIKLCETELLARLDADDIALPMRFEKQVAFLRSHPAVGLVGTQVAILGSRRVGPNVTLPCDHRSIDAALLRGHHALSHSTIMCRTALLREVGGYWDKGWSEDWDMYLRMGERAELANLSEVLLHFRVLETGIQGRYLADVRQKVAYAGELALRRRAQKETISYEQFCQQRAADPFWRRAADAMEAYAKQQYRCALPEILGDHRMLGYARLAWAAACSPQLTWQRVCRMTRHHVLGPRLAPAPAPAPAATTAAEARSS